jgi:hypothetical protein
LPTSPVTKGGELEKYFSTHYKTPFFFSAQVIQKTGLFVVELHKIFRQADPIFIVVLNRIRRAEASIDDMIVINERCNDDDSHSKITLTTTNKSANQINKNRLDLLPAPEYKSYARVNGDFNEEAYPTEKVLTLKKNAQIMMIKNNGNMWVNGSLALVSGIVSE